MKGLLDVGHTLTFGFAVKLGAYLGAPLLMLIYLAALPSEHHPFLDDKVIYSLVVLGLAVVNVGRFVGVSRLWSKAPMVERYPVLR